MSQLFITGNSILQNRKAIETVNLEKLEKIQYMDGLSGKDKTIIESTSQSRWGIRNNFIIYQKQELEEQMEKIVLDILNLN